MRRVISLFLPTWATDRLRRRNGGLPQPEVPLITAVQDGNQRVIAAVDEAARRLRLHPGMTIAHAQSLVPGLHIHDAMPQEDEAALARLALWCTRYSPLVATDPPDGIFIDIAGSAHLFKGETALLQDLKNRMALSKIAARGVRRCFEGNVAKERVNGVQTKIRVLDVTSRIFSSSSSDRPR